MYTSTCRNGNIPVDSSDINKENDYVLTTDIEIFFSFIYNWIYIVQTI